MPASFAAVSWSGANSGTDLNWSDSLNWFGNVVPTSTDDVKFFDDGATSIVGSTNNIVDVGFGGTISSLQYGNTNNFHTMLIPDGTTLTVNGTLTMETPGDPGVVRNLTNSITGNGATLVLNNSAAVVCLNQGTASLNGSRANLNLSGLGNFVASVNSIGMGSVNFTNPVAQRLAGQLILAKTNIINLSYTDTLANYQTSGKKNALEMVNAGAGNNASIMTLLLLGITNAINVDSIGAGRDKASASSAAWIGFNPAFTNINPSAYFRGVGGANNRIKWWGIGDMNANASSAQVSVGTNDFIGGTINAMADVMSLARDTSSSHSATASIIGVLTFNSGTINVNTLYAGNQSLGPSTSVAPLKGFVNVTGPNATLIVNSSMVLARTNVVSTAAANSSGVLNVIGGTVMANSISRGANTTTIALSGAATLTLTNTCGTPGLPIQTFNITNSTLNLFVSSSAPTNICVTTLNSGGAGNTLNVLSVPVFSSYPKQVSLISYATLGGAGYNFTLAPLPASAPGGYLSNNVANKTIDLVLPTDPRPVVTSEPSSYSGSPGDNVSFTVGISSGSVTPLSYQWFYSNGTTTNQLTDGAGPSGSSALSGSTGATVSLNNAQPGDDGSYFVIITNAYGAATSAPPAVLTISAGNIAPGITGPNNQTAIQGNNATFSATVTGNPAPTVQWQRNGADISGQTGTTLTVTNVQYPADNGAVYSIIASNVAGSTTNSATLTVIVPPSISSQPTNIVVTNTQSATFSVTATGVPTPGYQWYKNNSSILNATNSSYTIANTSPSDIANYSVTITNAAGTTNSATVTLTVNSTMSVAALSPANSATGICYDTPLYITFTQAPTLRNAGTIKIYNVTNATTPVDILDMSLNLNANPTYAAAIQARSIAGGTFSNFPVVITNNSAAIYPHLGVMTSNQTYYVIIADGVFADGGGAYFAGISATNIWEFSTKPTGPANPTNIVVAGDGSGDFVTVQGAVDSVPSNNTAQTLINIRNGTYTEIVYVNSKHNIKFRGQSRAGTIVGYPNNNNVNGNGAPWRSCFVLNGNDCSLETLTLTNMTPKGGSQAEAIDIEGTRATLFNIDLDSYQDTFLVHSANKLVYIQDCLIQGDADFNWGYGTVYYTNCEIRCLTSGGHVTQPRSPQGSNGFGFINCRITKGYSGSSTFDLGRTIGTPTSPSEVLFANCLMDDVVSGYSSDAGTNMADYMCSNLTATVSKVLSFSMHSTASDPYVIAIQSATSWLYGWSPALVPNILSQPTNLTVNSGATATFSVSATAIPNATYQWLQNGTNAPYPSANSATLSIPNAQTADAGSYSVVVANNAGSVTSSVVTLTVNVPTPPTINATPQVQNDGNVQFTFSGSNGSAYRVWATTNLALSPLTNTWTLVSSGTFGASQVTFTDSNATNYPQRFYIISSP